MKLKLKYAVVLVMAAVCLVLAGCGARVDTSFSADRDFSGKRVMTLTLSESDLKEYVTGGAAAIEATVKKYKPADLSYSSAIADGSLVYEFTLEFNGIEDYRSKVAAVFEANPENSVDYKIEYENIDSPFKSSLAFSENFTSIEMLGWLTYGLQQENVVSSSSTSNWYETGTTVLVMDGTEYSPGSRLSMSLSENNCADEVTVETRLKTNGNAERSFTFAFYNDTVDALKEKGTVLEDFFSALAGDGSFSTESDENYGMTKYIIKLGELSPEEISAKTAEILLDESIYFGVDIAAVPASDGEMKITVSENINASAYLRRSAGYLQCSYFMPDGTEASGDGSVYMNRRTDYDGNTYFTYYPEEGGSEAVFTWKPKFEKYAVIMGLSGSSLNLSLKMSVEETMNETAQSILKEKLENSLAEGMKLSEFNEDGFKGCEIQFDSKTVAESYKNFVAYYTGNTAGLIFNVYPASNGSPFTKQNLYSIYMDTKAITGSAPVELVFNKPLGKTVRITEGSLSADEENPTFMGYLSVTLVTEELNLGGLIIAVFMAAAFIGFVVVVLISLKGWTADIKNASASARARAAERAAVVPASPASTAPTPTAPAPKAFADSGKAAENAPAAATGVVNADTSAAASAAGNINAYDNPAEKTAEQSQQEEEELI